MTSDTVLFATGLLSATGAAVAVLYGLRDRKRGKRRDERLLAWQRLPYDPWVGADYWPDYRPAARRCGRAI